MNLLATYRTFRIHRLENRLVNLIHKQNKVRLKFIELGGNQILYAAWIKLYVRYNKKIDKVKARIEKIKTKTNG